MSPSSSPDQKEKRMAFLTENFVSWRATSRIPIDPLPLSLIPGPRNVSHGVGRGTYIRDEPASTESI
jgi:hypothetical protein